MTKNKVIVDLQYGDSGKGKVTDFFAKEYEYVCRFQGGNNAGHTYYLNGKKIILHQIPAGILTKKCKVVIGRGTVFTPSVFFEEIARLKKLGFTEKDLQQRIYIDEYAHVVMQHQVKQDLELEKTYNIGTTKKGIGPCYAEKALRIGFRIRDLLKAGDSVEDRNANEKVYQKLLPYLKYPTNLSKSKVLCEGAQSILLDVNYGDYPHVTSSHTLPQFIPCGLANAPRNFQHIGVFKAYTTKVSTKTFPTEDTGTNGDLLRRLGSEYGSTTGRPRKCGWLNLLEVNKSIEIGAIDELILTKADILTQMPYVNVCYAYDKKGQPIYQKFKPWKRVSMKDKEFKTFFNFLQKQLNKPIKWISYGPNRKDIFQV